MSAAILQSALMLISVALAIAVVGAAHQTIRRG